MGKDGRWAREILARQQPDGQWGFFHTLSDPRPNVLTTEQALRRLRILGWTMEDEPIARAVAVLEDYLAGKRPMPDRREKTIDWDVYLELMPAAWITLFTSDSSPANRVARKWAGLLEAGFRGGRFDGKAWREAYRREFGHDPAHARTRDPSHFYVAAIAKDHLKGAAAQAYFEYVLNHPGGVYYMSPGPLAVPPADFCSKAACRWLGTLELLAEYRDAGCQARLSFAADWLLGHRDPEGTWDMGPKAKEGVYFPLSDSWRDGRDRRRDCTERITAFLNRIAPEECPWPA